MHELWFFGRDAPISVTVFGDNPVLEEGEHVIKPSPRAVVMLSYYREVAELQVECGRQEDSVLGQVTLSLKNGQ